MQLQALLTASLLLLLFWKKDGISSAAEPGYLDFDNLPETNFSCESKVIGGYYADVETGCQMFHVCTIGQKGEITDIKFLCLNGTVFDQETRVCERLDEVDCSKTESFFDLNLQLYGNKAGPFGIEPENEEIVEEECDPEDEEECQRTEDGRVREDDEEGTGGGGPGVGGGEKVPLINNNNGGAIQQTTFSPISVATTTTKRPNVFSSTSTARVPTSTLQPSTTGQPAFQSGDPDTIAALLALHNAFAQSLQHHDINNKQQQEQQQAQQQEQIDQQQRDIEEHQRKQHLQQIQQQKQQEQLQHQQAQLQQHQAQLDQRQQKITQQAAKQAANAYVAAVESQAPHPATVKPVPPPPQQNLRQQQVAQQNLRSQQAAQQQVLQGVLQQQNLRPQQQVLQQQNLRSQQVTQQNLRSQQAAQQQVLQGVLQQGLQEVRQQQPPHRFPGQIHYDTSKQQNPVLQTQQEQQQKLLQQQQQHRFPQQQVHYETSTSPQQDSPQRFPHYNSKPESNPRFPAQIHFEATKTPVIGAERFGGGAYVAEATKSPVIGAERFGGGAYGAEVTKSPVIGADRFGGGVYQQNFGQQRGQSGERPKPFSFHQYDSQPSTTASPYLLHQLKVNRVKQEQQHSNFPRQASQRSITTPAVAVVTSTSTTTSIRSGATKKGQLHTGNDNLGPLHTRTETFLGSSVTSSSSELLPGNNETAHAQSEEYEDYQEGDVGADPFFQDVPKIGRNRRDVNGVVRDSVAQKGATFSGEVAGVKGSVRDSEKEKGAASSGGVAGVKGSIRESETQNGATFRKRVACMKGSVRNSEEQSETTLRREVAGVEGSVRDSWEQSEETLRRKVAGVKEPISSNVKQNDAAFSDKQKTGSNSGEDIILKSSTSSSSAKENNKDFKNNLTMERETIGENYKEKRITNLGNERDSKNQTRKSSLTGYVNKKNKEFKTLNKNNRKNLKTKDHRRKNTKISEPSGKVGLKDKKNFKKNHSVDDRSMLADSISYNNKDMNIKILDDSKFIVRNSKETQASDSVLNSNHEQKIVSLVSNSLGNENIYTSRKLIKREARYVQRDDDEDDDRYVQNESEEEEEDDDNHVGRRNNKSSRGKNVRKISENRRKPGKSGNESKKNDKRNRKVETGRSDRERSRESMETEREGSEEKSGERSGEEVEESEEEEVKKVVNKKGKVANKVGKPVRKPSPPTTTPRPVKTTTKPQESTMKKIPLDNNEFTDIIDKVEGTISAKVVGIEQTEPHKNKDNLQLSPEERKYYTEVSSVMSKYIPPTIESETSGEGESTPNMSARDKQRLSMFVTSKEKRKKKKNVPTYVIRNKRQVEKEKKQYEVSEIVDEPTTAEPSARRLINQYRTSGVVPSQLISELIQRMDLSSREQGTVPKLREPVPGTGSRRELGGQVSSREQVSVPNLREPVPGTGSRRNIEGQGRVRTSSSRRKLEKVEVSDDMGERSDPNTQSLRDVISNGGHHRMVLQKGSGKFRGQTEGSRSSDQGKTLLSGGSHLDEVDSSTLERSTTSSNIRGVDSRSSSQGKTAVINRAVLDEEDSHDNPRKIELKSKPVPLVSSEESLEKDDSDSSMDYSLEKEESNPSSVSLLKNGERRQDSYAVSEEDVGDEKPSTNLPFLYQDQIGRANTGDERFSDYESGLGLAVSVDGEVPRGNLNDRVSNFHKKLVIFTAPNLGSDIGSSENSNQRITSPERGPSSPGEVPRGNLNDRVSNFQRVSTSRENLQLETSGRHHEPSRTTIPTRVKPEGSLESTRVRNRPIGSLRQSTNVGETDSESDSRVTPVPRRRRPTSRTRVNSEEPVETSSESGRNTGVRRQRPVSRGRENLEGNIPQTATISRGRGILEENIPQTAVGGGLSSRQSQRPRSRGNSNLSVGNTEGRSSGRTSQVEDGSRPISGGSRAGPSIENSRSALDSSRSTPDSFRPIPQGPRSPVESSRSAPDSSRSTSDSFRPIPQGLRSPLGNSRPILDSSRSIPDDARTIPESSRLIPDNTWIPDSSRSVVESSRLVPQTSSNLEGSRSIAESSISISEGSRSTPESSRSITDSSRNLEGSRSFPESSRSITDSSRNVEGSRTFPESSRTGTGSLKSVTSRRKPSNIGSEQENVGNFEESRKPTVNTQQSPRGNRQRSRARQQSLSIPKASTTEATTSEGEEEKEQGEEKESYDSRAKKLHSQLFPGENFSCEGKIKGGFYADIESDCRGFFICSQGEINGPLLKSHFWCGEATKFNQRSRTCQADYLVECSISTRYFGLNNDFAVPTEETNTFEPLKVA